MADSTIPPARAGWVIPLYNPNQNSWGYWVPPKNTVFKHIGAAPPTPPSGNIYPLQMPAVAAGEPVTVGEGSDQIQLQISGNPTSIGAGPPVFDLLLDGRLICNDFVVTSFAGMNAGQYFTIKGNFGAGAHSITLSPALTSPGLTAAWITAVQFNSLWCYYNGPKPDARDHTLLVNATNVWDNENWALTFTTTKVAEPPPIVVPTESIISGAKINGDAATAGTLAELEAKTPDRGVLTLPAGSFVGSTSVGNKTIEGAGQGKTTIDATGLTLWHQKAIFVPVASGATFRGMTLRGAHSVDNSGAAIRQDGENIDFSFDDLEVTGCDNGLLTFSGNIAGSNSYFHDNGASNGLTHEMYFGNGATSIVTLTNVISRCGEKATHPLKSRFATTIARGCTFYQSPSLTPGAPVAGRIIDIPNGGILEVSDSILNMTPNSPVHEIITYAANDVSNGTQGASLTNVKINSSGEVTYINAKVAVPLTLVAASYTGPKPTILGFDPIDGDFTPATVATATSDATATAPAAKTKK